MLIPFIVVLAALGAAVVFRGREVRGLLVLLVACATVLLYSIATARWPWVAYSIGLTGLCLVSIAIARRDAMASTTPEPEPAPPADPERDPNYCFNHKEIEAEDER